MFMANQSDIEKKLIREQEKADKERKQAESEKKKKEQHAWWKYDSNE